MVFIANRSNLLLLITIKRIKWFWGKIISNIMLINSYFKYND